MTEDGSRVATHCLYPSFESVNVFVVKSGAGFQVHDGVGAARSAWTHGRDDGLICRMLDEQAKRYQITVVSDSLVAKEPSAEWLTAAILSAANASTAAAHAAVERYGPASDANQKGKIRVGLK